MPQDRALKTGSKRETRRRASGRETERARPCDRARPRDRGRTSPSHRLSCRYCSVIFFEATAAPFDVSRAKYTPRSAVEPSARRPSHEARNVPAAAS